MQGKIKVAKDGPYLVSGKLPLDKAIVVKDDAGFSVEWKKKDEFNCPEQYALCRCGASKNHPFCDGSHVSIKFDGTETASSSEKYLDGAGKIEGPGVDLTDKEILCFGVGFCHNKGGSVWDLARHSDVKEAKDLAIKEACNCPSGRLVVWDKKTGKPIEPTFTPSLSLIEEPSKGVSGPIWVKGNVEVESCEGKPYEKRNRCTLCRCGASENKPFCDGMHVPLGFNDGDSSLKKKQRK